jgi:hypothetical protein
MATFIDLYDLVFDNINRYIYDDDEIYLKIILSDLAKNSDTCAKIQNMVLLQTIIPKKKHLVNYHPGLLARALHIIYKRSSSVRNMIESYCPLPDIIPEGLLKTNFNRAIKNAMYIREVLDKNRSNPELWINFYDCAKVVALYIVSLHPSFLNNKLTRGTHESNIHYLERWLQKGQKNNAKFLKAAPVHVFDKINNQGSHTLKPSDFNIPIFSEDEHSLVSTQQKVPWNSAPLPLVVSMQQKVPWNSAPTVSNNTLAFSTNKKSIVRIPNNKFISIRLEVDLIKRNKRDIKIMHTNFKYYTETDTNPFHDDEINSVNFYWKSVLCVQWKESTIYFDFIREIQLNNTNGNLSENIKEDEYERYEKDNKVYSRDICLKLHNRGILEISLNPEENIPPYITQYSFNYSHLNRNEIILVIAALETFPFLKTHFSHFLHGGSLSTQYIKPIEKFFAKLAKGITPRKHLVKNLWKVQQLILNQRTKLISITIQNQLYIEAFKAVQSKDIVNMYDFQSRLTNVFKSVHSDDLEELLQDNNKHFQLFHQQFVTIVDEMHSIIMKASVKFLPYVKDVYSIIILNYGMNQKLVQQIYFYYNKNQNIIDESDRLMISWIQGAGPMLLKILQKYVGMDGLDEKFAKLLNVALEDNSPLHDVEFSYLIKAIPNFNELKITTKPLSVASLGQVHRAVYKKNHTEAILKFIKPNTLYLLDCEFNVNREMSIDADKYLSFMFQQIIEECSFKKEVFNMNKGKETYGTFSQRIQTIFPFDVWMTDIPIMTMSVASGTSLHSVIKSNNEKVCRNIIPTFRDLIYLWTLKALFTTPGYAHVDLHPGNIMIDVSSLTLTLIDFGNFIHVQKKIQHPIISIIYFHNKIIKNVVNGNNIFRHIDKIAVHVGKLCNIRINSSIKDPLFNYYQRDNHDSVGDMLQVVIDNLETVGDCAKGEVTEFVKGLQLLERTWNSLCRVAKVKKMSTMNVFTEKLKTNKGTYARIATKTVFLN